MNKVTLMFQTPYIALETFSIFQFAKNWLQNDEKSVSRWEKRDTFGLPLISNDLITSKSENGDSVHKDKN